MINIRTRLSTVVSRVRPLDPVDGTTQAAVAVCGQLVHDTANVGFGRSDIVANEDTTVSGIRAFFARVWGVRDVGHRLWCVGSIGARAGGKTCQLLSILYRSGDESGRAGGLGIRKLDYQQGYGQC